MRHQLHAVLAIMSLWFCVGVAFADQAPKELPHDAAMIDAEIATLERIKARKIATSDDVSGNELYLAALSMPLGAQWGDVITPGLPVGEVAMRLSLPELRLGYSKERRERGYLFLHHLGGSMENQMFGFGIEHVFGDPVDDETHFYLGGRLALLMRYLGVDAQGGVMRRTEATVPLGVVHEVTSMTVLNVGLCPSLLFSSVPRADDPSEHDGLVAFQTLLVVGMEVIR